MKKIIKNHQDLNAINTNQVILLYSGGLDSTYLLTYLTEDQGKEVIALNIDIGSEDNSPIEHLNSEKATIINIDAKNEFVSQFILPAIQAGCFYGRRHPLSASLSRPLFASIAYDYAQKHNIQAIIHCASKEQNSLRRFNTSLELLEYQGTFGTPFEDDDLSRQEKIEYLNKKGIAVPEKRNISIDTNLWCREFETSNSLTTCNLEELEQYYSWTKTSPDSKVSTEISISFFQGIPSQLNKRNLALEEIIYVLNHEYGVFGFGRYSSYEEGPISKMLEHRETPAAFFLLESYYEALSFQLSHESLRIKNMLSEQWVKEASEGRWFSDTKAYLDHFFQRIAKDINYTCVYELSPNKLRLKSIINESVKNIYQIKKAA